MFPFQQIPTKIEQIPLLVPFMDTTSESGDISIISPPFEPPTESDQSPQISQTPVTPRRSQRQEPQNYLQASKDDKSIAAMAQEIQALENNNTWEVTALPLWIRPNRELDYLDSFSPVEKSVTMRVFLAVATSKNWPILQLDVNNAFLHGHLNEDVYMQPPKGYTRAQPGQVCHLRRSLYGLKQASRQWNYELTSKLLHFGFTQSIHDHCLFLKRHAGTFIALLVYVDDILLAGDSPSKLDVVKGYLDDFFTIKDLGHAKYFLGLELARSHHGLITT
ncbi:UNVERIFIED_CONTAM: hypothetical protein Sradi_2098200 [Sesamum radiatum]|uniref:Reverse transcriptase Ty1/copia-type domain-containing protein n=1 Tax=Sesamum radiatum TaxID=300843 RepID=A0AAW2TIY2_SESRA